MIGDIINDIIINIIQTPIIIGITNGNTGKTQKQKIGSNAKNITAIIINIGTEKVAIIHRIITIKNTMENAHPTTA